MGKISRMPRGKSCIIWNDGSMPREKVVLFGMIECVILMFSDGKSETKNI